MKRWKTYQKERKIEWKFIRIERMKMESFLRAITNSVGLQVQGMNSTIEKNERGR